MSLFLFLSPVEVRQKFDPVRLPNHSRHSNESVVGGNTYYGLPVERASPLWYKYTSTVAAMTGRRSRLADKKSKEMITHLGTIPFMSILPWYSLSGH